VAENAIPACVVPLSFLAKGNREERVVVWRGDPLGPFFQFKFRLKHTEEIKVMQAPFKCASMLSRRLVRVV
jgi:hypothetical protein